METVGIEDGTPVEFRIWERGQDMPDKQIAFIESEEVQGDKAKTSWIYVTPEHTKAPNFGGEPFSSPDYYFTAAVAGIEKRSQMLGALADIEIVLKDDNGDPVPDEPYVLRLSTGELRKGNLDKDGYAVEKQVPPRGAVVVFPNVSLQSEIEKEEPLYDRRFQLVDYEDGQVHAKQRYRITTACGVFEGVTDEDGYTENISTGTSEDDIKIEILGG